MNSQRLKKTHKINKPFGIHTGNPTLKCEEKICIGKLKYKQVTPIANNIDIQIRFLQ